MKPSLQDVENGTYSTFHNNNISPVEQMASPKVDSLDKFLDGPGGDFLEQYCAGFITFVDLPVFVQKFIAAQQLYRPEDKPMVPPISKKIIISSPPSSVITPSPASFDKLTLAFTPDSDDELSDSDDDSAFLPFDEDTLLFYESCLYDNYTSLPFIKIQQDLSPFSDCDMVIFKPLSPESKNISGLFFDQRVSPSFQFLWKLSTYAPGFSLPERTLVLSTVVFKFFKHLSYHLPSIFDHMVHFVYLFEFLSR
jgi:hypothetical protein